MRKEPEGTFQPQGKEPIIKRIDKLIKKYPSRSAAARAWGINVNTLNSYFKNVENPPMPREVVLQRIADKEAITLEWLLEGRDKSPKLPKSPAESLVVADNDILSEMLSFLSNEERQQLALVFARKGVEATLEFLFQFASLSPSEFDRAIRLAKQVKEGASDGDLESELTNPTNKQVG